MRIRDYVIQEGICNMIHAGGGWSDLKNYGQAYFEKDTVHGWWTDYELAIMRGFFPAWNFIMEMEL